LRRCWCLPRRRSLIRRSRPYSVTILERFFSRTVAFTTPLPAIRLGGLDELSVDAAPTELSGTILERFFFRTVAFTTPPQAIRLGGLDELSVDAAPTEVFTILERFFFRSVAFTTPLPAIRLGGLDELSVDAAPTMRRRRRRWWWWWRATTFRRTGKRPPPAMRWLWRTGWMFAVWRTVPFVATTAGLPPPAAAYLDPNPLATIVGPLASIDSQRCKQKGVLLAVASDPLANNQARIADRLGHRQDVEVARGKIAKRVEIKHLAVRIKERVVGAVACCRGSDDHSGCVVTLLPSDAVGRARSSTEGSQIGDGIA
jgi:hypothetical protein